MSYFSTKYNMKYCRHIILQRDVIFFRNLEIIYVNGNVHFNESSGFVLWN